MKKRLFAGLLCVCMLLLCACTKTDLEIDNTLPPTSEEPSIETYDENALIPPETTEATETEPPHSELYIEGHSPEQILEYFEEVVMHVEYSDGPGDYSLVQKWITPIYYRIYGYPTDEDLEVLTALFAQLNEVPGFPGIYPAVDGFPENLSLSFLNEDEFYYNFSDIVGGQDSYGAVQFWYYIDTNDIYSARIGYRTDIDQESRNSVLIEEIVNMLGFTDTEVREDSIVYQYSNENLEMSDVDWVLMKLLYNPAIECGMDYEACAAVIQELYY